MKKQIRAIIFDIEGVLSLARKRYWKINNQNYSGIHAYIIKQLKIPFEKYFDIWEIYSQKAITGTISEKKFLQDLSKAFNISTQKLIKAYKQAYDENYFLNLDLYNAAFDLKKQGYKIVILSNQSYLSALSPAILNEKLIKNFDLVVLSHKSGLIKPDINIYQLVLTKLRLKPKEAVLIDDQIQNIAPAERIGMYKVLFKNNAQVFKDLNKLGIKTK